MVNPQKGQLNHKRYQPDINKFLALCGRNYFYILKWLPDQASQGDNWLVEDKMGSLSVRLIENTNYTQLIEISRSVGKSDYIHVPCVTVRVYHDAKLAEVLTSRQISQLSPVYDYPNIRMYHRDEKYQVNAFLEELLKIGGHMSTNCLSKS
ncbi:DUF1249 domain-containing protein [Shewanella hanedai]|jgi:uncharacterized protein YqiB (DUF1249 family)|uniref:DUF1249 domain-containing protein n=1 Tax=Shewanella hanedai TaxID=25 RepID=A0A553JUC0_SHEHA|nr:DUF1249 domain-containing protein [Shewanella hanedai]TRY16037.1 DUF1249 domain-containing protein [Shewanella hanedai]